MLLPGKTSRRILLILTVVLSFVALSETSEDNRLDIRFGFDLTQGNNGAPILRVRDFEDSRERYRRAADDDSNESKKHKPKAESSDISDSGEAETKKESSEKPAKHQKSEPKSDKSDSDDDNEDSSDKETLLSTRGLKPDDYEPEEENPKIHSKFEKHSAEAVEESDENRKRKHSAEAESNNESSRRRRRSLGDFKIKRIHIFS